MTAYMQNNPLHAVGQINEMVAGGKSGKTPEAILTYLALGLLAIHFAKELGKLTSGRSWSEKVRDSHLDSPSRFR